jgi:L-amino acid N-acyltransferase
MPALTIRLATRADLPAINEIYNHYVLHSTCTYQEEPSTVAEENGQVLGWAALSTFHPRSAYRRTVENSVYVRSDRQRQGIGTALLADSIERARALGHHTIIAGIDLEQAGSIELHRKLGFQQVGDLCQVGFKFGRWLDVAYLQKML